MIWQVTLTAERKGPDQHCLRIERTTICRLVDVPAKVQDLANVLLTRALWHVWNAQPFEVVLTVKGRECDPDALSDLPPHSSLGITVQRTIDFESSSPSSRDSSTPAPGTTSNHGTPDGCPSE
jgi:hypothetical protein